MKSVKKLIIILGLGWSLHSPIDACTGIALMAQDGSFVHGRTAEFGLDLDLSLLFIPKNTAFKGITSKGEGLSYTAKFAAIGSSAFSEKAVIDGINEQGLAVGAFYFPGFAHYALVDADNQHQGLSPIDFPNWILTQFATVEEVKASLSEIVLGDLVLSEWGNQTPPFHYIVLDSKGKSLVIEPLKEGLKVYDNTLGIITNSPGFDWHLLNLRNYMHLSTENPPPRVLDGITLTSFGQGAGMMGIPGDFSPPSRFVRAVFYTAAMKPSSTGDASIFQGFHLLNQFDIPKGSVRQTSGDQTHEEWTLATVMRDSKALKYYFRTYEDEEIRVVDLKTLIQEKASLTRYPINTPGKARDITKNLMGSHS